MLYLIPDFTGFGLIRKMPLEVIMEKFKSREYLTLAYMRQEKLSKKNLHYFASKLKNRQGDLQFL